jgi:hypothetical protein
MPQGSSQICHIFYRHVHWRITCLLAKFKQLASNSDSKLYHLSSNGGEGKRSLQSVYGVMQAFIGTCQTESGSSSGLHRGGLVSGALFK